MDHESIVFLTDRNKFIIMSGTHLCSHIVTNVVFSAGYVLTVVFGMGTGVTHSRISTRQNLHFVGIPYQESNNTQALTFILRKEVIHPHVLVGIPCYDFTPVISPAFSSFRF